MQSDSPEPLAYQVPGSGVEADFVARRKAIASCVLAGWPGYVILFLVGMHLLLPWWLQHVAMRLATLPILLTPAAHVVGMWLGYRQLKRPSPFRNWAKFGFVANFAVLVIVIILGGALLVLVATQPSF